MRSAAEVFLDRVNQDIYEVDEQGNIRSYINEKLSEPLGSPGNTRQNLYLSAKDGDKVHKISAQKLAWMIHTGDLPPKGYSVVSINQNRKDFRRENLMLVPSGQERTVLATVTKNDLAASRV